MPAQYSRDDLNRRALIRLTGVFELTQLIACLSRHRESRGRGYALICDARRLTTSPSTEDLRHLALYLEANRTDARCGPVAMIVPDQTYAQACSLIVMTVNSSPVHVFRHWDEAAEWIAQQVGFLPLPTQHWIDSITGVAHLAVRPTISAFQQFLDGVERLITRPTWRPGDPVIEDLRYCAWLPPETSKSEWQSYVSSRQALLEGCRWAVVRREHPPEAVSLLQAASEDARLCGFELRHFTRMQDAHDWVQASTAD